MNAMMTISSNNVSIENLVALAIKGLQRMYDSRTRLFCYRLARRESGFTIEGVSHRYTIMTILGMLQAQRAGYAWPFDLDATIEALYSDTKWIDNAGDLGLLLWLSAATHSGLARFDRTFDLGRTLDAFRDARKGMSMQLAWLLTGLSYTARLAEEHRKRVEPWAKETYERLARNQGEDGLFGHLATRGSLAGVVRGRVGSFADQVYPIYAMARFGQIFENPEALQRANACATAICRMQGPLGQWWWHYDSVSGSVMERYPVYSVHQHAMAPMALFTAQNACGADFNRCIYKGLNWIAGTNELNEDLRDEQLGVVWRNIAPASSPTKRMLSLISSNDRSISLSVLHECRPYELGWLLYAFAGRVNKTA